MTGRLSYFYNKLKSYIKPTDGEGDGDANNLGRREVLRGQNQNLSSPSTSFVDRNNGAVHHQSTFSSYFSFGNRRKRPADQRLVEVEWELTDDEEDPTKLNGGSFCNHHQAKKLRTTDLGTNSEENMAADGRRYVTRGSGIDPSIKGLNKQPWMFDFKSKKSREIISNDVSEVEISRGTLYGVESNPGPSSSSAAKSSSSLTKQKQSVGSDCFKNFRFQKNQKEIEVITLDEDNSNSSRVGKPRLSQNLLNHVLAEKQLKSPKKTNFFKSFNNVLNRNPNPSSAFRLREKLEYANLLKKMQMSNFGGYGSMVSWSGRGRALEKSKLNSADVTAKYYNFDSPTVTFNINKKLLGSPYVPASSQSLVGKSPRNFSMPSSQKNTPATSTPELIDISFEDEEEDVKNSKSLVVRRQNGPFQAAKSLHTSFHDLNEALQASIISESEDSQDNMLAIKGQPDSKDSQDISIISKDVLEAKPRSRRLNSLALEHQDVPCTKKDWLDEVSSSWREEQRHREKQIMENMETIDVLQKESTIEKDLRERMRNRLRITEIIVLEEPPPSYPEITKEMHEIIDNARRPGYDNDVLATVFGVSVTRGDIKTLAPCKWLNDNVINVYMELISKRSKQEAAYPSVHAFSTFFYPKLMKEGYSNALKRWTRKVDIFASDLLVFPIHLGLHWCLACVDFRRKTIKYYDSLGGRNDKCLHGLLNYIALEKKERKSEILNKDEWKLENVEDTPQQENGSDCGMFSCKVAEYLSRDAELTFSQENMNYFRERMIYEIIKSDLLFP